MKHDLQCHCEDCRRSDILLEQLAELEHKRWSSWMRWMFDNWSLENITRWKKQMVTAYVDLSEYSKESDRKEARKTLAVFLRAKENLVHYIVGHRDYYHNDLKIKIVDADGWKDALVQAFPFMEWLESEDLEKGIIEARIMGHNFNVKILEIKIGSEILSGPK